MEQTTRWVESGAVLVDTKRGTRWVLHTEPEKLPTRPYGRELWSAVATCATPLGDSVLVQRVTLHLHTEDVTAWRAIGGQLVHADDVMTTRALLQR
jgi:hypothetical protein